MYKKRAPYIKYTYKLLRLLGHMHLHVGEPPNKRQITIYALDGYAIKVALDNGLMVEQGKQYALTELGAILAVIGADMLVRAPHASALTTTEANSVVMGFAVNAATAHEKYMAEHPVEGDDAVDMSD